MHYTAIIDQSLLLVLRLALRIKTSQMKQVKNEKRNSADIVAIIMIWLIAASLLLLVFTKFKILNDIHAYNLLNSSRTYLLLALF